MTKPLDLAAFDRLPVTWRAGEVAGLSGALDAVADTGPAARRFLRYQWYAAALDAYGGSARTLVVESEAGPGIALPLVASGPRALRAASVPGCYWPFRSFPVATDDPAAWDTLVDVLAGAVNVVHLGPVYDGDTALEPLKAAALRRGWAVLPRRLGKSFLLDVTPADWPRASTLKKNRWHEKQLAQLGELTWELGATPEVATFDALAQIEAASWIASDTDGRDAKFNGTRHAAFWRSATADPVLARMLQVALLRIDGRPAAFSFDIDAGSAKYAIANSYDPAFARSSPGKLLIYRNLVAARARGITSVEWGSGDGGYKSTIGAEPGPTIRDWLFVRPGLPALAGRLLAKRWATRGR